MENINNSLYGNIRVDDGVRRIGVNDNGDYISLSVNDVSLLDRFSDLIEWFENKQKELQEFGRYFNERHARDIERIDTRLQTDEFDEDDEKIHNRMIIEVIRKRTEVYRECCEKIDQVFGKDCCKKVFGEVLPDEALLAEFLDQMTPIMAKMANERGEKLRAKYNSGRRGKKNVQRSKEELIAAYGNNSEKADI